MLNDELISDKTVLLKHLDVLTTIANQEGIFWTDKDFKQNILMNHTFYVMNAKGFACVSFILDEAELLNIAVLESEKGKGLARKMWGRLQRFFDEKGIVSCFLEVRKSNKRARGFYEKMAFQKIGERKEYYTNPTEDAVIYKWEKL